MPHDAPAISVVMPALNVESYVAEAVESVLGQTFGDFELVVIDDGSTDGTRGILEQYRRTDPRVRVADSDGSGLVDALSTGVRLSRAELIARHDADDRSVPDRFRLQFEYLRLHPEVGLLGSALQVIDSAGSMLHRIRFPMVDAVIRLSLIRSTTFGHGAVMVRRSVLDTAGGYRAEALPAEDYDLWCRIVASGTRVANLDQALYEYRVHDASVSSTKATEMERSAAATRNRYSSALIRTPTWSETSRAIDDVVEAVRAGEAELLALRRVSRSLADAAAPWFHHSLAASTSCVRGALVAERAFRRLR